MNFIQFLAGTLHSFDVTDSRSDSLLPVVPVLGVDGPGDGLQGGLGVGDQEAAEAEQRQGEEAVGSQHQQTGAQGAAGATQGPQTSATKILSR